MDSTLSDHKKLDFKYFNDYADFILKNKLREFSERMLLYARSEKIPILKLFDSYNDEQLIEIGMTNAAKMLTALASNGADNYIDNALEAWKDDQIAVISKEQIKAEDLTLISLIRRKAFRFFLPLYTKDVSLSTEILEEVDAFTTTQETLSLNILLNHQQNLFKEAQTLAHIGNWTWDLQKNILIWSEELYKIYELSPTDKIDNIIIGTYNHPADKDLVLKSMQVLTETNAPQDFYYRIIVKNKEKHLHAKAQVIIGVDGKPTKFFGTLQDVTQQKLFENEITEKQNFIEKITDISPSMITVSNIQTGKYVFINSAIKKLLGYEPDNVMQNGSQFFLNIIHPDDLADVLQKRDEALKKENKSIDYNKDVIGEFRYRIKNKEGAYKWFHTYSSIFSRDDNNKVECILNISFDQSNQYALTKELEEKKSLAEKQLEYLAQSEERYHQMVAEVQEYAILLLDTEGVIQNWNVGAERIKGYKSEDIVGKNFRVFYPKEDAANLKPERLIKEAIETGRAIDEGWRVRKDASQFWASVVITALHDKQGNIIGFSKVTRDLTERKMNEERLKEYAQELEQKNKELIRSNSELESFTYISSHDLQEPLRKIQILSDSILQNEADKLSDKGRSYLKSLIQNALRMQNLIQDILSFAQLSHAKDKTAPVDLNAVLKEIKSSIIESGPFKLTIQLADLPTVHGISFQLRQVFNNLISNAIKYRKPKNDEVIIKVFSEKITADENCEPLIPGEKYYKISVADNGIGFDQTYANQIFELFKRLHSYSEYPGTGIGLALCKKIIENHKGTIKACGKKNEGATFEVYLLC